MIILENVIKYTSINIAHLTIVSFPIAIFSSDTLQPWRPLPLGAERYVSLTINFLEPVASTAANENIN